jgi:acyl-CoA hydrolase
MTVEKAGQRTPESDEPRSQGVDERGGASGKGKRAAESLTEQVQVVQQQHINGYQRLFGGQLMAWMDVVAGVTARRHSGHVVTTAFVDNLEFLAPAYINNLVIITGRVTHVGRTSLEVLVDVEVEAMDSSRKPLNRAYFVMVALDAADRPVSVPPLILETEAEREEWAAAEKRRAYRQGRRQNTAN